MIDILLKKKKNANYGRVTQMGSHLNTSKCEVQEYIPLIQGLGKTDYNTTPGQQSEHKFPSRVAHLCWFSGPEYSEGRLYKT